MAARLATTRSLKAERPGTRKDLRAARELAKDARTVLAARRAYQPLAARRAKLMRAHAVMVGLYRADGLETNVVPDGRGIQEAIDADGKLRRELRALPLLPPPETIVPGAIDSDRDETITVLLALDRDDVKSMPQAARLAAAAAVLPNEDAAWAILVESQKNRRGAVDALYKRVKRSGAFNRWRSTIRRRLRNLRSLGLVPGETAAERAAMIEQQQILLGK